MGPEKGKRVSEADEDGETVSLWTELNRHKVHQTRATQKIGDRWVDKKITGGHRYVSGGQKSLSRSTMGTERGTGIQRRQKRERISTLP